MHIEFYANQLAFLFKTEKIPLNRLDTRILRGRAGSPGRTRTSDRTVNSRLLYQLSYRGTGLKLVQSLARYRIYQSRQKSPS